MPLSELDPIGESTGTSSVTAPTFSNSVNQTSTEGNGNGVRGVVGVKLDAHVRQISFGCPARDSHRACDLFKGRAVGRPLKRFGFTHPENIDADLPRWLPVQRKSVMVDLMSNEQ